MGSGGRYEAVKSISGQLGQALAVIIVLAGGNRPWDRVEYFGNRGPQGDCAIATLSAVHVRQPGASMPRTAHRLLFVTGASGVGKTSTLRLFEQRRPDILVRHFDGIVPPLEAMIKEYGSGEEWQRQTTLEWVGRIKTEALARAPVVLDGQARQAFVEEACSLASISNYRIILFDWEDAVRELRLIGRGQPELTNSQMANWARYLRDQASRRGGPIIDTTRLTVEDAVNELLALLNSFSGA
jgi:hypothetical protein